MQQPRLSPASMFISAWRNRSLVGKLVRREVVGRYRGSVLGIFWSLFNPLLMLAVYTFVFSVVFQARWQGGGESRLEFALLLFLGLIVFTLFAECVNRAPSLILANANYVKKVVFPLEILPMVAFGAGLFHALVSLGVWFAVYLFVYGLPPISAMLLPFIILPLALFVLGLCWALASLGVYLRDVAQVVVILTTMLMFLSPIFYPLDSVPETFRGLLAFNPLALVIEQCRDVLFWGKGIDASIYFMQISAAAVVAWGGYAWFQVTRKGFADVL